MVTAASDETTRSASGGGSRSTIWAAYAACAWAFVFAAPSFYWAVGGTTSLESTVSPELVRLAHDRVPWFVAALWITGVLKIFGGLLALALVRRWGRIFPGWMLLTLAWRWPGA